ncbi:hypothetical protein FJTKL_01087 [Diaporthe vaccinii]|uniref:Uncharacterized protein n=1 Tax=Diaporthe vaccinii TaxID=105482 RepID=A0ABR4F5G7_9PEZI
MGLTLSTALFYYTEKGGHFGGSQFRQEKPLSGPVAAGCGLCVVRHQSDRESRIPWSTRYPKQQRRHPPAMVAAPTVKALQSQELGLGTANSDHLIVVLGRTRGTIQA